MNLRIWAAAIAMVAACGCASVEVPKDRAEIHGTIPAPSVIYVRPFETERAEWLATMDLPPEEFKKQQQDDLTRHLLVELGELTQTQRAPDALPNEGLLVTGQFVSVDPGHGAARWFAGLYGAGQSRAVTHVEIYDLAKSKTMPVADFDTEGGSRGAGGIVSAGEGLDADWWRTAREIRTFIEEQSGIKPVKASSSSSSPRDR